jgi:hypothetical protein
MEELFYFHFTLGKPAEINLSKMQGASVWRPGA